ncbi:LysR family transcriptional regulator [Paraburkholderia sp. BR13439]|uniref:LysR family transcriptional regulator n=1 Tax=Paraburkholderia TaxID=1822464 RepID=UPI0034CF84A4
MNFTHLFAFYEVARAGSLSGGARRLRVSQSAVSREVKELDRLRHRKTGCAHQCVLTCVYPRF